MTVKRTITITIFNDNDEEETHELPACNEVCDQCDGFGSHTNPSIDGNGITAEDWSLWDSEERDNYLAGKYDITCKKCGGSNVLLVPDPTVMSAQQKEIFIIWQQQEHMRYMNEIEEQREQERESRMLGELD